jgi:hypothetical protein
MALADNQLLGELVECADMAIRTASQLNLFKLGRAVRDKEVLNQAIKFLEAAEAGGNFMSSGGSASLNASLRPLNWVADVCWDNDNDYEGLTRFLRQMKSTVNQVLKGENSQDTVNLEECIQFFDSLEETLGMRADQNSRYASMPCFGISIL